MNVWANGGVYRLEAEQVINYPTNSQPSVVVPGCGTFYDPEYMTWYPMDDSELFYDISCKENVDSYDPNDKQAEPVGYSNEHYIEANTDLEYQLRFQNTGTDTAYHVVIVDTLPEHLDVSTFRLGVSSHPCEVTVSSKNGLNILRFNFEFANLLPLTVDETQSSGYIKFNISQLRDLAEGTQIYNDASIYFDFNDPIVTNKTKHTIASNFIIEDLIIGGHTGEETPILNVVVGPNPIIDHAIFEVLDMDFDATAEFLLYSADGKLIRIANLTGNTYVLERNGLAHGMYLYSIILSTGDKYHGKIIFR